MEVAEQDASGDLGALKLMRKQRFEFPFLFRADELSTSPTAGVGAGGVWC